MEENENKYLKIEREIFKKYGFDCGMVIQYLKDHKGHWKGSLSRLSQNLYPFTRTKLRMSIISLKSRGYIIAELSRNYVDMKINKDYEEKKVVTEKKDIAEILEFSKKIIS